MYDLSYADIPIHGVCGESRATAIGKVDLELLVPSGPSLKITLTNVHLVADSKFNLLASPVISTFTSLIFDEGHVIAIRGNQRVPFAERNESSRLYETHLFYSNRSLGHTTVLSQAVLWHRRLGHISADVLRKFASELELRPKAISEACDPLKCVACIEGKITSLPFNPSTTNSSMPFNSSTTRSTRPLQLLHSDVSDCNVPT